MGLNWQQLFEQLAYGASITVTLLGGGLMVWLRRERIGRPAHLAAIALFGMGVTHALWMIARLLAADAMIAAVPTGGFETWQLVMRLASVGYGLASAATIVVVAWCAVAGRPVGLSSYNSSAMPGRRWADPSRAGPPAMPKVLIADKLESSGLDLLTRAGLEVDNRPGLTGPDLVAALRDCDAVICRSQPKLSAEVLNQLAGPNQRLKAIARAGVGVDNIDVPSATRLGVVVMNTPGGNTISAAEHTVALMMALARQIAAGDAKVKSGGWDRAKFLGTQLTGKTLGIVGLGRIGLEVAKRATGLGMTVVGFDPFVTSARAQELGVNAAPSLDALLPQVDFLTIHSSLTPETRHMIGAAELARMRKTARVLNVARGGIIDEQALAEALHAGTIAGAAVDVFEIEPPPADHPLRSAPNCVVTPHLGASTVEAQESVALEAAQLIIDFLERGTVLNAVNMAAVDRAELDAIRPHADLARRLGLMQAQLAQGPIRKVQLTYKGDLADQKTKLLTASFTLGLLEYRLAGGVNLVNAMVVARERGIEVGESLSPKKGDFASVLSTEVETDSGRHIAAGTLFGDQYQRLVQVGPYRLESYLDGVLLFFHHLDEPGLIGFVGTLFGKYGVNIAAMSVGRAGLVPGGPAIGVLNLDTTPPEEAIAEVRAHPKIEQVSVVNLPPSGEVPAWLA